MKFLICLLLLLPISAYSQVGVSPSSRELGFNLGHAFDNAMQDAFSTGGYLRSALNFYQTKGHIQYGLTIEGGTNGYDYWYLSPGVLTNYKFSLNKTYIYAGFMAGYVCSDDMMTEHFVTQSITQGYVFGLQGGLAMPVSKRFSVNAESAARSTQVWTSYKNYETESNIIIYFPITVGIRYSLK